MNDELERDTKEMIQVVAAWRVASEGEKREEIKDMNYKNEKRRIT
jgi:hypothetical protein